MARFVREGVVHFGAVAGLAGSDGPAVYFLCEKKKLLLAMYGGPGFDNPPVYKLNVEAFHVVDDVDCMMCLVAEGRRRG